MHKFDNNPQFQKMLNGVGKQLSVILFEFSILLLTSLKLGLLNDPYLSKALGC